MSQNWLGKAKAEMKRKGTEGSFRAAATRKGLKTMAYAKQVTRPGSKASPKIKKKAQFALNATKGRRG